MPPAPATPTRSRWWVGAVTTVVALVLAFVPALHVVGPFAWFLGSGAGALAYLALFALNAVLRESKPFADLAPGTVRNYLSVVIAKTRARNRVDAVRIAQESGWL